MKDLLQLLHISYPVIQAPMLGVTTPDMVAAISNLGGLGSIPAGGLSPENTVALIQETKAKTSRPFAVNLFAHPLKSSVEEDIHLMEVYLEQYHHKYGLTFSPKPLSDYRFYNHLDQIDILLQEQVPVVSFTFGLPDAAVIRKLKDAGIKMIGTATSVKEAKLLDEAGMDAITAQGIEAGGHRGSFMDAEPLPQVGLISLVPQIADCVSVPVIAAGGLFDHRTIRAAFALGAAGVQLGSYFIAAEESAATDAYKDHVLKSTDTSTTLTRAFTGKWARGIINGFMEDMERSDLNIPYYTWQNSLTAPLRAYGKTQDIGDLISMWAGQSAANSQRDSTANLFLKLISEIQEQPNPVF